MAKKKKSGILGKIFKLFLFLFLLLVLVAGGFAAGVYFQIFDTNEINEKLALYKMPVVGEYFPVPPGAEQEQKDESEGKEEKAAVPQEDKKQEDKKKDEKKPSKPVNLTKEEIERQTKEREAAERKRVSKLARLYNEMKPQEAADAMADLDDDLTVAFLQRMDEGNAAKTLAKREPEKTARLTKLMYEGKKQKVTLSGVSGQQTSNTAGQ